VLPGLLGLIQATEVVKLVLGKGDPLVGRLLLVDALAMSFRELKLSKDPECPVCGANPTVKELIDYEQFCGIRGEETPVNTTVPEIQPEELKRRLDAGDDIQVLDVREPFEYQIANLGAKLIPLGELAQRAGELDSNREIVTHCKGGVRSLKAAEILRQAGFQKVSSMAGGILAWSDKVDPKVPKY
jgi:adenylyltransferase/sulfurtransferase